MIVDLANKALDFAVLGFHHPGLHLLGDNVGTELEGGDAEGDHQEQLQHHRHHWLPWQLSATKWKKLHWLPNSLRGDNKEIMGSDGTVHI